MPEVWSEKIIGDCLEVIPELEQEFDLVIADPPYSEMELINSSIYMCSCICSGASFFFMYAEDICDLEIRPDQVLFWIKPPSTKNTKRRYSRFVEVICVYDIDSSPFNQEVYWHCKSGVFQDVPLSVNNHPHTKPESLIEKIIAVNSNPGDTVLDPFAGSGTVSNVCSRLGRNCISIEKNA